MQQTANHDLNSRIIVLTAQIAKKDQELEKLKIVVKSILDYANVIGVEIPALPSELKAQDLKLVSDSISLITDTGTVRKGDALIHLTTREFKIFECLYNNVKKTCTRDDLMAQFNTELDMTSRNIDVHVFSLRRKLQKLNIKIETVWGVGYKITL